LALVTSAIVAFSVPAAQAEFGVEKFVAVNCAEGHEQCAHELFGPFSIPKEPTKLEAEEQGYTQAGGHVPFGVTDFQVNTEGELSKGTQKPSEGKPVTHIRTDVAPGLATSPSSVPQCTKEEFGAKEAIPGTHFYLEPKCAVETKIGINKATVYAGEAGDLPLEGNVYNLVQKEGRASEFGVALKLPKAFTEAVLFKVFKGSQPALEKAQYFAHTLIEGSVEWGQETKGTNQGDYHDYFEIDVSPALPLISSRLVFYGRSGQGQFITNATSCPGHNTTNISLTNAEGKTAVRSYTTPVGLSGCNLVPFEPNFVLAPATTANDTPNGLTTELSLVRHPEPEEVDSAQLKSAVIKLPEGMTLSESAAHGLTACTPAEARIHSSVAGMGCPSTSELGTVALEVPTLPPGSLQGKMYLGGPESGPITAPPYVIYLDAESARYGISVRIKGEVVPNETTGQLTTTFAENPEQPFTKATLHFKEGALAPVANPLVCGAAKTVTSLAPFTGTATKEPFSQFVVDSNNAKGACASPLPFSPTQSTQNQTANAGGFTSFTLNIERSDGQQLPSQVKTVLPPGLVGAIPAVTPCGEPQAAQGTCTSASEIGTARVLAGAGPTPYAFKGPVYLTGPYNGAPYGLSIAVPAVAGPFNLGTVVTRATINVKQDTAQVVVTSILPRIVKGIPVRFKRVNVAIEKQSFLFNPTNCSAFATESSLTGFTPGSSATASAVLSSPFAVGNCGALAFKPSFKAVTGAKTSKANGASLETTLNAVPGQANVKSVLVQLPKALPSRLTTLQKACPEATFAANPYSCPSGSYVGGVRANTPTLPGKMKGPAVLVSHGGAAFPDLDLVLEANGVRVILIGNTDIKKGITTTNFASTPDVPVSSVTVNLPVGPHSALGAITDLCTTPLVMPTTITGQNGKTIKQNTKIGVSGCGVRIVGRKVIGHTAYLTIKTFAAGRVSGSGRGLAGVSRRFNGAVNAATLKIPLARGVRGPLTTRVRVGFVPKRRGPSSVAYVTLHFR
jgi:hypothetical protein